MFVKRIRLITKVNESTILPAPQCVGTDEDRLWIQTRHPQRREWIRFLVAEQTPALWLPRIDADDDLAPRVDADQGNYVGPPIGGLEIERVRAPVAHGESDDPDAIPRPEHVYATVRASINRRHLTCQAPGKRQEPDDAQT